MTAGAAAQLDPPVVLSAMKSFLTTARPASPPAVSPRGTSLVVACIAQLADSIACHSSACRGLAVLADVRAQAQQFAARAAAAELAQVRGGALSGVVLEVLCHAMLGGVQGGAQQLHWHRLQGWTCVREGFCALYVEGWLCWQMRLARSAVIDGLGVGRRVRWSVGIRDGCAVRATMQQQM